MAEPTHSISVRLQRTTIEEGYVSVTVTDDLLQPAEADGTRFLDGAKVLAAALPLEPANGWLPESSGVEVHPIQKAPDDADG